jgi:DNA-binding CsgD family transcriptional regulator
MLAHNASMGAGSPLLEAGRTAYAAEQWATANRELVAADREAALPPEDLELLARSAYMLGRDDDYIQTLERAHHAYTADGHAERAVRCAFWIGHNRLFRGDAARAMGWFGRAQRMLDAVENPCVENGYLLIPLWLQQMGDGDYEGGLALAVQAADIGEQFSDADLVWLARDEQGRALLNLSRIVEGLRLVDEALIAASAGELSPVVTGIVYCNTIAFCQDAFALRHARAWTVELTQWCDRQPEMVEHNGLCLVHRAEIKQFGGAWTDALDEARRAAERSAEGVLNSLALGNALYRQGEIHRLRGDFAAAEDMFRRAGDSGYEPQPGLALLRLAEGNAVAAAGAIRRAVSERTRSLDRAVLLPAYVEIMVEVGEHERADAACRELEQLATQHSVEWLAAMACSARGRLALALGDADTALGPLRQAWRLWHELDAPYEAARLRVLLGFACGAIGDHDTAAMELEGARRALEGLQAIPDLTRLDALASVGAAENSHGLTDRELAVLQLIKAGSSNREIAARLTISEHTVARHVQNIFAKLGVSSRTAASAYAFEHNLA